MKKCAKTKNPCKICYEPVTPKTGLRCKGACKKWAHYTCLNYTPGKIQDIKNGFIKVLCPCPGCETKGVKETVVEAKLNQFTCKNKVCPANSVPKCTYKDCASNTGIGPECPQCPPKPLEPCPSCPPPQPGSCPQCPSPRPTCPPLPCPPPPPTCLPQPPHTQSPPMYEQSLEYSPSPSMYTLESCPSQCSLTPCPPQSRAPVPSPPPSPPWKYTKPVVLIEQATQDDGLESNSCECPSPTSASPIASPCPSNSSEEMGETLHQLGATVGQLAKQVHELMTQMKR